MLIKEKKQSAVLQIWLIGVLLIMTSDAKSEQNTDTPVIPEISAGETCGKTGEKVQGEGLSPAVSLSRKIMQTSSEVLWQIGRFDGTLEEFKSHTGPFYGYPAKETVFIIGQSETENTLGILPGPAECSFHGVKNIPFKVIFELDKVTPGTYAIIVGLSDKSMHHPGILEPSINGRKLIAQWMPPGSQQVFHGKKSGHPAFVQIRIPAGDLKPGKNELILQSIQGGYVSLDAVALVRLSGGSRNTFQDSTCFTVDAHVKPEASGETIEFLKDGFITLGEKLSPHGFEIEFTLEPAAGECAITYELPRDSRDSVWGFEMEATAEGTQIGFVSTALSRPQESKTILASGFLHGKIRQDKGTVSCTVSDSKGREIDCTAIHVPASEGRLSLRSGKGGQVSNWSMQVFSQTQKAETEETSFTPVAAGISCETSEDGHQFILRNGRMELEIDTTGGRINPRRLTDTATGRNLADGDYLWAEGYQPDLTEAPVLLMDTSSDGSITATIKGAAGDLEVVLKYTAMTQEPGVIHEQITIRNTGQETLSAGDFVCGFAKTLFDGKKWDMDCSLEPLVPIPYRYDAFEGVLTDYHFADVARLTGQLNGITRGLPAWSADGWAWESAGQTLLISKYNPKAVEWSRMDPVWQEAGGTPRLYIRFGGAGKGAHQDPDMLGNLEPGQAFEFGTTRYEALTGDWKDAHYSHRAWMQQHGIRTPEDYTPRVHWNVLYDAGCPVFEDRSFFNRELMRAEATKAAEIGCETLYIDPGWDTGFSNSIWAAGRLGPMDEFSKVMRQEYGLTIGLHTPLGAWSVMEGYPDEALRMNEKGERLRDPQQLNNLCSTSIQYREAKAEYLLELCKNGAVFLMFDGSVMSGPCHDSKHGHSIPLPTRQEHFMACHQLCQVVHEKYPDVSIELHNPLGGIIMGSPTYFCYNQPGSFDELWGDEDMWNPLGDLLMGRGLALYYRRLAYDIPTYLHINLKADNPNAIMFWYYASVVQHLGIGGKHEVEAVWQAHKEAMKTYMAHKDFYVHGIFHGIEEEVHAHTLPGQKAGVLNLFNFKDDAVNREVHFRLEDIGLPEGKIEAEGCRFKQEGDKIVLTLQLPPLGHQFVKMNLVQ
jgi:hypothetical protein